MFLLLFCFFVLILFSWFLFVFLGSKIFNSGAFGERSMFQCFHQWNIGNISFGTTGIYCNMYFYELVPWSWTVHTLICILILIIYYGFRIIIVSIFLFLELFSSLYIYLDAYIRYLIIDMTCWKSLFFAYHLFSGFSTYFLCSFSWSFSFFFLQVNPIAVNSKYCNVFTENKRVVSIISTAEFGKVC